MNLGTREKPHSSDAVLAEYAASSRNEKVARLSAWYESARHLAVVVRGGPGALRACENATGLRGATIRRWAFAASRIDDEEYRVIAGWRDSSGQALSVWHFVELARLARPRRRALLIEMRPRLWSVVKIRDAARRTKHHDGTDEHS